MSKLRAQGKLRTRAELARLRVARRSELKALKAVATVTAPGQPRQALLSVVASVETEVKQLMDQPVVLRAMGDAC